MDLGSQLVGSRSKGRKVLWEKQRQRETTLCQLQGTQEDSKLVWSGLRGGWFICAGLWRNFQFGSHITVSVQFSYPQVPIILVWPSDCVTSCFPGWLKLVAEFSASILFLKFSLGILPINHSLPDIIWVCSFFFFYNQFNHLRVFKACLYLFHLTCIATLCARQGRGFYYH